MQRITFVHKEDWYQHWVWAFGEQTRYNLYLCILSVPFILVLCLLILCIVFYLSINFNIIKKEHLGALSLVLSFFSLRKRAYFPMKFKKIDFWILWLFIVKHISEGYSHLIGFIQKLLGLTPVWRVVEFFFRVVGHSWIWLSFFFFVFAFKRTNNDHLSVSRERNVANPAYQMFESLQLQRSCMENQGDGLADWFVIEHTRDEALSSDLLSRYGFKVADATQVGII